MWHWICTPGGQGAVSVILAFFSGFLVPCLTVTRYSTNFVANIFPSYLTQKFSLGAFDDRDLNCKQSQGTGLSLLRFCLFWERRVGRRKKRKKNINVWDKHWSAHNPIPRTPLTRGLAHSAGVCPDWEWHLPPFRVQDDADPLSHTSQGTAWVYNSFLRALLFPF